MEHRGRTGSPETEQVLPRRPCRHRPQAETIYTTGGRPASLKRRADFPVEAVCEVCELPIRREQFEVTRPRGDWQLKYLEHRLADFRARHPEITITEDALKASWFSDDGPHEVSYSSPARLTAYLEARFDTWRGGNER